MKKAPPRDLFRSYLTSPLQKPDVAIEPVAATSIFEKKIGYSVNEAAYALGLSEKTIRRAIRGGELVSSRIGSKIVIQLKNIEAWLTNKESHT
ncbi:helix-turn-helix domain-containing protein [Bdellovibrio sp.]|uniref:helix-turn-helix domain-containing protein n=1 Tax=Bdellovibrio sp. TaxID=28201 RepID=UPI0032218A5B